MFTTIVEKPLPETVERLTDAIADAGMLLLCHINGQANAAKIGETVPAVRVLEVFRPELAVRVWRTHQPAGIDIPVRLYVYENEYGETVINYRSLAQTMAKYDMAELTRVGYEADEIFAGIIHAVTHPQSEPFQTN